MSPKCSLSKLISFLDTYLSLVNTSMVEFITLDLFSTLADDVQKELLAMDDHHIAALPSKLLENSDVDSETPVGNIVTGLRNHSLEMFGLVRDFRSECSDGDGMISVELLDRIMPEKKMHEVCQMSKFLRQMAADEKVSCLVDIGSGKGYLSQVLTAGYKIPVLAMDCDKDNTKAADRRGKLLTNKWGKLLVRAEQRQQGKVPSKEKHYKKRDAECDKKVGDSDPENLLVNITECVETDTDCGLLVEKHLPTGKDKFGIIGLHTCGDLAPNSIRIFLSSPGAKFLCNVGCCYRPLSEQFRYNDTDQYNDTDTSSELKAGFPLSNYLLSRSYTLGRLARTLSSQPLSRLGTNPHLPGKTLLWRAVLQVLAAKVVPHLSWQQMKVGNIGAKCGDFVEYVRKCFKKIGLDIDISDQEISELYEEHEEMFGKKLNCFYQFRAMLAPLVESVILLDRLVFLEEQRCVEDCYLVKMFDNDISPRSYAVVAVKF